MDGKNLADDRRDLGQVFPIAKLGGREEIRRGDDKLQ